LGAMLDSDANRTDDHARVVPWQRQGVTMCHDYSKHETAERAATNQLAKNNLLG